MTVFRRTSKHRTWPITLAAGVIQLAAPSALRAEADDWPTYRHDNRRSGVTREALSWPLRQVWVHRGARPEPAWTGPAKWDAYASNRGLQSLRNIDPVFYVTAQGQQVFFGSSADDAVHCLDAASGRETWATFADGPVRFPPTWQDGKLYFGSDDGFAYCVLASTGGRVWRFSPRPEARLIANNGRLISPWPLRTGVLIQGGAAYFGASLLPWQPSYLCALGAGNGSREGVGRYVKQVGGATLQGAVLASPSALYVPQGRSPPLLFKLADGTSLGAVKGGGGVSCLLTDTGHFASGPAGQKAADAVLRMGPEGKPATVLTVSGADRMVVREGHAFMLQGERLVALDLRRFAPLQARREALGDSRKDKARRGDSAAVAGIDAEVKRIDRDIQSCYLWRKPASDVADLVVAADVLLVGGRDRATAYRCGDGERLWAGQVSGVAYGLAVARGRLYVSTDSGAIHCFTPARGGRSR